MYAETKLDLPLSKIRKNVKNVDVVQYIHLEIVIRTETGGQRVAIYNFPITLVISLSQSIIDEDKFRFYSFF